MQLVILLIAASLWYFGDAEISSTSSRARIPRRFNGVRLWKRQQDGELGYLEQCSILQFWDKQIGRVNVLAFFDSSWQFSHRQAAMLRVLRERFDRTGFDSIQFFAVNAAASEAQYIDRSEIQAEEETWKQISPSEAEGLPPVTLSPEALVEALGPDVYFIQDSDELQIWPKLRAFRDQILVIDRCGRLTYQVIVPWSILHFPYVKAAILSTYKDEPCGHCQFRDMLDSSAESSDVPPTPDESSARASPYDDSWESSTAAANLSELVEQDVDSAVNLDSTTEETTADSYRISDSTEQFANVSQAETYLPEDWPSNDRSTEESTTATAPAAESSTGYPEEETTTERDLDPVQSVANCSRPTDRYTEVPPPSTTDYETDYTEDGSGTTSEYNNLALDLNDKLSNPADDEDATTTEGARLKDSEQIESIDSRDVLKSRSTNARSVAPNDGLELIEISSESSSESSPGSEYAVPIRIIMRAPHVDEYSDRTVKAHEYLVLKTGLPDYHGHLESSAEGEESRVRKKSEAVGRTYGKDESPGLYGELADYWRNFGNDQSQETAQSSSEDQEEEGDDDREDEQVLEQPTELSGQDPSSTQIHVAGNDAAADKMQNSQQTFTKVPAQHIDLDNAKTGEPLDSASSSEDDDVVDEEAKSKLIAHYSKLLPWLYYVLAK